MLTGSHDATKLPVVLLGSAGIALLSLSGLAGMIFLAEHRRLKAKRPVARRFPLPSLEALDRVNRELGTTLAVITHNAAISGMADRVLTMADGRIAQERVNETRASAREITW